MSFHGCMADLCTAPSWSTTRPWEGMTHCYRQQPENDTKWRDVTCQTLAFTSRSPDGKLVEKENLPGVAGVEVGEGTWVWPSKGHGGTLCLSCSGASIQVVISLQFAILGGGQGGTGLSAGALSLSFLTTACELTGISNFKI